MKSMYACTFSIVKLKSFVLFQFSYLQLVVYKYDWSSRKRWIPHKYISPSPRELGLLASGTTCLSLAWAAIACVSKDHRPLTIGILKDLNHWLCTWVERCDVLATQWMFVAFWRSPQI